MLIEFFRMCAAIGKVFVFGFDVQQIFRVIGAADLKAVTLEKVKVGTAAAAANRFQIYLTPHCVVEGSSSEGNLSKFIFRPFHSSCQ